MDWEKAKLILEVFSKVIIILAAMYGTYEFFLFRKSKSVTEDEIDLDVYPTTDDIVLLDIRIRIHNKSRRRMYMKYLLLGINMLRNGDLEQSIKTKKMLRFTDKVIERKNKKQEEQNNILDEFYKKEKDVPFWVDAGITQTFFYPIAVRATSEFIQINCEYWTGRTGNKFFSKVIRLEKPGIRSSKSETNSNV